MEERKPRRPAHPPPTSPPAAEADERLVRCAGTDPEALLALLEEDLSARQLVALLRNPHFPRAGVEAVAAERSWVQLLDVRRLLVRHPHTPRPVAVTQVAFLFWRDLASITSEAAVHPVIRRAAERRLVAVLEDMALGEKLTLARIAPREIIRELRKTDDPRVVAQLLLNPRLTEEDVGALARSEQTPQPILSLLARNERWVTRRPVRIALLRNPALPLAAALPLVPALTTTEARDLARCRTLSRMLAQAVAARLKRGDRRGP